MGRGWRGSELFSAPVGKAWGDWGDPEVVPVGPGVEAPGGAHWPCGRAAKRREGGCREVELRGSGRDSHRLLMSWVQSGIESRSGFQG